MKKIVMFFLTLPWNCLRVGFGFIRKDTGFSFLFFLASLGFISETTHWNKVTVICVSIGIVLAVANVLTFHWIISLFRIDRNQNQ